MPVVGQNNQEAAKEKVNEYSNKIKWSARSMLFLGVVGLIGSVAHNFGALKKAGKMIQKRNGDIEGTGSEFVSRDELAIYETLKSMSYLWLLVSLLVMLLALTGLCASWHRRTSRATSKRIK